MPKLLRFVCDSCDFELETWENGTMYATNKKGRRIEVRHPGESYQVAKILKIKESDIFGFPYMRIPNPDLYPLLNERVGVISDCLCLNCLEVSKLDFEADERKCHECGTDNIVPVDTIAGMECPKCKKGTFNYENTGIMS